MLNFKKSFLIPLIITFLIIFTNISYSARLPTVGDDYNAWGHILNDYLETISGKNATSINVTENLRVDGYTHLGDYSENALTDGDLFTKGLIYSNKSVISIARPFGFSFGAFNFGSITNFSSLGGTALMDVNQQLICDSTAPFLDARNPNGHEHMFFTVINSTPTNYFGATGIIKNVVNSTCIEISVAAAGLRTISDSTSMNYYVYKTPLFAVLDRGSSYFHIGKNPDAKVWFDIPDGRGPHGVYIEDTCGVDSHKSLTIDTDGKGYDGVVGINQYLFSSTPVTGKSGTNILLETDGTNVNNSHNNFIQMILIGAGNNNHIDAIHVDPNVEHIIHMGSEETLTHVWYDDATTTWNATGNFTNQTQDMTIFENDNSIIYLGNDDNFTTIGISLDTISFQDILAEYYYCQASGNWTSLQGVTDTTNGFQVSGSILFTSPDDRGTCFKEIDGTNFASTINKSYVAIKRTRNNILSPPIENLFSISGGSSYFILQKDLMRLNPVNTAPEACDANMLGAIYFDTDNDIICYCGSGGWLQMDDAGTACA